MNKLRILLADDHAVVREGLKAVIQSHPEYTVVGEAADGPGVLALAETLDPDLVLVDVSMPGLNGAEVTARLRVTRPNQKVLALTVHEDRGYLRLMLDAGVSGYVLKRTTADELLRAIGIAAAGGTYIDPAVAGQLVSTPSASNAAMLADLSEREEDVVKQIAQGYSNKEIAARLRLSVKTVETYKSRSFEKLGIRTRVGLVRYAAEQGWLVQG